jgi:hypothetical protein
MKKELKLKNIYIKGKTGLKKQQQKPRKKQLFGSGEGSLFLGKLHNLLVDFESLPPLDSVHIHPSRVLRIRLLPKVKQLLLLSHSYGSGPSLLVFLGEGEENKKIKYCCFKCETIDINFFFFKNAKLSSGVQSVGNKDTYFFSSKPATKYVYFFPKFKLDFY